VELKPLTIHDKELFGRFLSLRRHELAVYAFPAIYGWKKLFDIRWGMCRDALCLFFGDTAGWFLFLPPLGKTVDRRVVVECFKVMGEMNRRASVSRIENAEEADRAPFKKMGYVPVVKSHDYVYERNALAGLKGDGYKTKRAMANQFAKNNTFQCVPYSPEYKDQCFSLYKEWMAGRKAKNKETVYCGMLTDSQSCLEILLEEPGALGINGLVVAIGGHVKAFTLGYRLNAETICVFFEIADLSVRGISQFIFRRFCEENAEYRLVNAMDDSGLENLKEVKESYRPCARHRAYIINRAPARG
jgi:uncharacterized protein